MTPWHRVSDGLVHIDEYKNGIDPLKIEFWKDCRTEQDEHVWTWILDKRKRLRQWMQGSSLSGQEMPTADIALFSRLIFLSFSKSEFTTEEKSCLSRIASDALKGMTHLTIGILARRKDIAASFSIHFKLLVMN